MSQVDAIIIGGGGFGLAAAWRLAQAGQRVILLERGAGPAPEATTASAGMIGPQSEAMEDDAYFAATLESRDRWPAFAAELAAASGMDLGYVAGGCMHLAFGASYERRLEAKYLWQKRRAGSLEKIEGEAMRQRWPWLSPRVSSVYVASGDHWVDNEKLGPALAEAARRAGAELRFSSEATALGKAGSGWQVKLQNGETIEAPQALVCAGAWGQALLAPLYPDVAVFGSVPVKGQMLELKVPPNLLPDLPVHAENVYLVPRGADRLLVGATVETVGYDKRITAEGVEYLLLNAFETEPDLRSCELVRVWAGLRPGSPDGWPVLGPGPDPGLHLALGAFRRGILFLPLACETLRASVLGQALPEAAKAFYWKRDRPLGAL